MYGPNTNLGHNSILFMLECQTRYILGCLGEMEQRGLQSIDVRPEVQAAYSAEIQEALAGTVWATVKKSWYQNDRGRITNNWPYTTARYFLRTRRADLRFYSCASKARVAPTTSGPTNGGPWAGTTVAGSDLDTSPSSQARKAGLSWTWSQTEGRNKR